MEQRGILSQYLVRQALVLMSHQAESYFFFLQAEDGIRDLTVTGVQTCALPISAGSANCLQFSAVGSESRDELVGTSPRVHDRIVDLDRLVDGNLPGTSGFTRRFDRRLERRRPRHKRQCAPTALPQDPRRRTSRAVGHAIGRRSIAHHELHPLESAKPRLPSPESLDGCDYTADLAVPRPSVASTFC